MNFRTLLFSTALGAAVILPANVTLAEDKTNDNIVELTQQQIQQGWKVTKKAAADLAQETEELGEGALAEIRQAFIDREQAVQSASVLSYNPAYTANGIINSAIENSKSNNIGTVEDIVVSDTGFAKYLIVSEGDIWSDNDRKVAVNFDKFIETLPTGEVSLVLTKDMMEDSATYDPQIHTGISLVNILDGEIIGANGRTLAGIEDVVLGSGYATHIVAKFDQILDLGGEPVALSFQNRKLAIQNGETDIVLSPAQTASLRAYMIAESN